MARTRTSSLASSSLPSSAFFLLTTPYLGVLGAAVHDGTILGLVAGTEEEAKDEVLVRANGIPTYFAADIAYHYNKLAPSSAL